MTGSVHRCPMNDTECWRADILEFIYPSAFQWILIVLFFCAFIMGLVGNLLVCYSVWRSSRLQTVTNYLLVNLAVADFLVILVCLPPSVIHDVMQSWYFGYLTCKILTYLQSSSVFVSALTLTAISIERYMAICHLMKTRASAFKTRTAIGLIWIISLITPSQYFVTMTLQLDNVIPASLSPLLTSCKPRDPEVESQFQLFIAVAFYLTPLCVMAFTYTRIAACLWSSVSFGSATQDLPSESVVRQLKARRRTAKMLIVVVIMFGVCYLPVYLINIFRYLQLTKKIENQHVILTITMTSHWLCYFNSAINPVIYNFMSDKFRREFRKTIRCCFNKPAKRDLGLCSRRNRKKTWSIFWQDAQSHSTRGKLLKDEEPGSKASKSSLQELKRIQKVACESRSMDEEFRMCKLHSV